MNIAFIHRGRTTFGASDRAVNWYYLYGIGLSLFESMTHSSQQDKSPVIVTQPSADAWDDFVRTQRRGHLLQLSRWGELKSRFGWEAQTVALCQAGVIQAGALVLLKQLPLRVGKMAYIPMGGYAEDRSLYPRLWEAIKSKTKAAFLKIEPGHFCAGSELDLASAGFEPSPQAIQPATTIIIDISGDQDSIMRRMNQGTRRKIRKSLKSDIEYVEGDGGDLPAFNRLMQRTGARNAFGVHSAAYFEAVHDLFMPQIMARCCWLGTRLIYWRRSWCLR